MMLAVTCSLQATGYVAGVARPIPALRVPRSTMALEPSAVVDGLSHLLAEEGPEALTPVFFSQLGLGAAMCARPQHSTRSRMHASHPNYSQVYLRPLA